MDEHTEQQACALYNKVRASGSAFWRELSEEERFRWYELSRYVDSLVRNAIRQGEFGQ